MKTCALISLSILSGCVLYLLDPQSTFAQEQADADVPTAPSKKVSIAPTDHLYSPYIADQKRVSFGLQLLHVADSDIPDTGFKRFALRMGGRLELFNWTAQNKPEQQLQANFEVGFLGHFDIDHSQDNIGWDGNYGLIFSYQLNQSWSYRSGFYHNSSHIGDEYAERTGRQRISYTREEVLLGAQHNFNVHWQYYIELGIGYHQEDKPLQKSYRTQAGIQFQQSGFTKEQRLGWYTGLDISAYEENDWSINQALQVGFAFDADPHIWRVALDYYRGRSTLGEFFQHNEEYLGLSLYLDI